MNRTHNVLTVLALVVITLISTTGCDKEEDTLGTWITYGTEETGIADFREFTICPDAFGNVYALQYDPDAQLFHLFYRPKDGEWQQQEIDHESRAYLWGYGSQADFMQATADGSVWLLGSTKLIRLHFGTVHYHDVFSPSGWGIPFVNFVARDTEVWLLHSYSGLHRLNVQSGQVVRLTDPSQSQGAYSILTVDMGGSVWVSTHSPDYNLFRLRPDGTWQKVHDPDSLLRCASCPDPQNSFLQFQGAASDLSGSSYFLGNGNTLFRITDATISQLAFPTDDYYDQKAIKADPQGRMWFFNRFMLHTNFRTPFFWRYGNGDVAETADLTDALPGNVWPYDLAFDRNNNAWIATNRGVVVYNREGIRF